MNDICRRKILLYNVPGALYMCEKVTRMRWSFSCDLIGAMWVLSSMVRKVVYVTSLRYTCIVFSYSVMILGTTRNNMTSSHGHSVWVKSEIYLKSYILRVHIRWTVTDCKNSWNRWTETVEVFSSFVFFIFHTAYFSVWPREPSPVFLSTTRKWNLIVACRNAEQ